MWLRCGLVVVGRWVAEFFRAIQRGSWGSMLAHVGSSWFMLAPGGFKLAPRWLKIALCWLKLVPRRPTWPPKASKVPQDETKMASKMASTSICFGFLVSFSRFASRPMFSNEFVLFGSLECINFCQFLEQISINFGSFLASWVAYAHRSQDTLMIAAGLPT